MKALAHIPLTLTTICRVFKEIDGTPETLTELYTECLCHMLRSNLVKKMYPKNQFKLMSKNEILAMSSSVIAPLCELALNGLKEKRFVFNAEDLIRAGFRNHENSLGLLIAKPSYSKPVFEQSTIASCCKLLYQFCHISIQELLVAQRIEQLTEEEQRMLFIEFHDDSQFYNIWTFLAGITKLQCNSLLDYIDVWIKEKNGKYLLLVLHCLFEAHSQAACSTVARKLNYKLDFSNQILSTTDCVCAAYTMASAGGNWKLIFRNCHVRAEVLQIFQEHLEIYHERSKNAEDYQLRISVLDLAQNDLNDRTIEKLGAFLSGCIVIETLDVAGNYSFGDVGTANLASRLKCNKSLTTLCFSRCGLTSDGADSLGKMLLPTATLCHLKSLSVGFQKIGDDGVNHIAVALAKNTTLVELNLNDVDMTCVGVQSLALSLRENDNQALEKLRIDHNDLGPKDCHHVANLIEAAKQLKLLDLSKNPIGDDGFITVLDAIEKYRSTVNILGVFGCEIRTKGMKRLCIFLKKTNTLRGIQMGCNPIMDEGAEFLIDGIINNHSLTKVWLERVAVTPKAKKELLSLDSSSLMVTFDNTYHIKLWRDIED